MSLTDTHCHLVLLQDRGLLDAALQSATDNGVGRMVSVGLDLEDSRRNCQMAETIPGVWFTVGWHPHQAEPPGEATLRELRRLLEHPRAVAVGEIGLDLFFRPGYHETSLPVQMESIHAMFGLAREMGKPVILHDREAHEEILGVMRQYPGVKGVMHCFSGDLEFARHCIDLGYVISFSGIVTFNNARALQEVAAGVPQGSFVIETDAPFLAPVPRRGQDNLPGYVSHTAAKLAELRQVTPAEIALQTTLAASDLFGLV